VTQQIARKTAQYEQLLQGVQKRDPRLYDILRLMSKDLVGVLDVIDPIQASLTRIESGATASPSAPTTFAYSLASLAIIFVWSSVDPTVAYYELRKGNTWETATFVIRTPSLSAAVDPQIVGTHRYLLKTLSATMVESLNNLELDVIVPNIEPPVVSASVIDNNVLLSWSTPFSAFAIDHYNVYKESTKFAEITGTFIARFEAASGTFTYKVEAVDVAGNVGAQGIVQATVRQPPDYVLQDSRVINLSTVTKSNCVYDNGVIVACIDLVETFENHFTSRSWASPQDQVTAGYDRWIQDNLLIGNIVDEFDYGTVFNNIIVTVDWVKQVFSGTSDVTVTVKMSYKVNVGDPWSPEAIGSSQFFNSFQFLRVKLEFTAPNDDAMITVGNVTVNVSVKREVDSGSVIANPADIGGTVATFNKAFKDIDSLTATSESKTPITVITDFQDAPNPTFFRVMAFDSAGQRVRYQVDWKARGIV